MIIYNLTSNFYSHYQNYKSVNTIQDATNRLPWHYINQRSRIKYRLTWDLGLRHRIQRDRVMNWIALCPGNYSTSSEPINIRKHPFTLNHVLLHLTTSHSPISFTWNVFLSFLRTSKMSCFPSLFLEHSHH